MPIYQFGYIIKQRREELGYTQEDLADGICSVPTLSRIENGERLPSKDHFEMLLQRLGFSEAILYTYVDKNTLFLHEQRFNIRQAVMEGRLEQARKMLDEYEKKADMNAPLERQFLLLYRTLVNASAYSIEESLNRFEEAIRMSCPKYSEHFFPRVLSYEEIVLLNNIAGCYYLMQNMPRAIRILKHIKKYYENSIINSEEKLRTQTMVLYNLSKFLGLAGNYDECIEVCDQAIKIARETGRCNSLALTLYNRAWSLSKRQEPGDMAQAEESARLAIYTAMAMGKPEVAEQFKAFFKKTFPDAELL